MQDSPVRLKCPIFLSIRFGIGENSNILSCCMRPPFVGLNGFTVRTLFTVTICTMQQVCSLHAGESFGWFGPVEPFSNVKKMNKFTVIASKRGTTLYAIEYNKFQTRKIIATI